MTREEEIKQKASKLYPIKEKENKKATGTYDANLQRRKAFEEGAKWADEHPNLYNNEKYHTVKVSCLDELNRKAVLYDTFLDKACNYLIHNMTDSTYLGVNSLLPLHKTEFIKQFREAMEE